MFEIDRKQHEGFAPAETVTHTLMNSYIYERILNGGHLETYSGTADPSMFLSLFLMKSQALMRTGHVNRILNNFPAHGGP